MTKNPDFKILKQSPKKKKKLTELLVFFHQHEDASSLHARLFPFKWATLPSHLGKKKKHQSN